MGRRDELERLLERFASAAEGQGGAVLVVGAAGTGKSRLLAEVAHAATCEGATVLTAHGREVEREKGLALGADDYITKPFSTQALVDKVKALLDESAA